MPAVPPRLAETLASTPSQLGGMLCPSGTSIPAVLLAAIGLCCILALWMRRGPLRAADEKSALGASEKRSGREMEFAWPPAGHPMYASAISEAAMAGGQKSEAAEASPLPIRRTSYTKQFGDVSMQGEIMVGDGWIRHTRVYGGGVCLACEDSKKKQKMIVSSQGRPANLSSLVG